MEKYCTGVKRGALGNVRSRLTRRSSLFLSLSCSRVQSDRPIVYLSSTLGNFLKL